MLTQFYIHFKMWSPTNKNMKGALVMFDAMDNNSFELTPETYVSNL